MEQAFISKTPYSQRRGHSTFTLFTLSLIASLAATASSLYTPSLPVLSSALHISITLGQFLVVATLLGHTISPLFFAYLANRFGRYAAIQTGLVISLMGTGLCWTASYNLLFTNLFIGCLLMTFGANAGITLCLTVIQDHETQKNLNPTIAKLLISFAILPGIAVLFGSYLSEIHWTACFGALFTYTLFLILLTCRIADYLRNIAPSHRASWRQYHTILKDKNFWRNALIAGGVSACFYLFNAQSPRLAINLLGLPPIAFGVWSNVPSIGMLAGTLLAIFVAKKLSPQSALSLGLTISMAAALFLLLCWRNHWTYAWQLFVATAWLNVGLQIIFPNAASLALKNQSDHANSAGFFSIIHMGFAGIAVSLGNLWSSTSFVSLPISYLAVLVFISALIFYPTATEQKI